MNEELIVSTEVGKVYVWEWDYPIEKNTKVTLLCGKAPRRITEIIDSYFGIRYMGFDDTTAGRLIPMQKKGSNHYLVVILYDWENANHEISVLAHETNHLVFTHFKNRGHHIPSDPNDNDEEAFCGHHEMWMRYFLDALNGEDKEKNLYLFENKKRIKPRTSTGKDHPKVRRGKRNASGKKS